MHARSRMVHSGVVAGAFSVHYNVVPRCTMELFGPNLANNCAATHRVECHCQAQEKEARLQILNIACWLYLMSGFCTR